MGEVRVVALMVKEKFLTMKERHEDVGWRSERLREERGSGVQTERRDPGYTTSGKLLDV